MKVYEFYEIYSLIFLTFFKKKKIKHLFSFQNFALVQKGQRHRETHLGETGAAWSRANSPGYPLPWRPGSALCSLGCLPAVDEGAEGESRPHSSQVPATEVGLAA